MRGCLLLVVLLLAPPLRATTNDARWRTDIEYVTRELPLRHANAFFRVSRPAFEGASAALAAALPTLSDGDAAVGLYRLVAMIGDSHTTVTGWIFARYPFTVYSFEDGWYVVASEQADLLGKRLVAIDDKPIEEVVPAVSSVFPYENASWMRSALPSYLTAADVLHALGIGESDREATFTFESSIERRMVASAVPLALIQPPPARSQRNPQLNYWAERHPGNTLYLKYNRCQNDPANPFATFVSALFAQPVETLIVDLRDNPGGNSSVMQPLLTRSQATPAINRPDRLFVLIGRKTFSSAVINAIQLDQQTNATLVGEPTGGKPNSYGEIRSFVVPSGLLTVFYSTRFFTLLPQQDPESLQPEVAIPPTPAAYFAGRDAVMDVLVPPIPKRRAARSLAADASP